MDGKLEAEVRDATLKVRDLAVVTAQAQLPVLSVPETKLEGPTAKFTEPSASLRSLAASRAQAVQTVLLAKPELTPERIVVAPELSGAEPASRQARVFLGIQW